MKSRRDPAHRAEADARAAAEAANRGETDDHETDVDETIIVKSPAATAPTDRAEREDNEGSVPEAPPTGGGAPPPSTEATPAGSGTMVVVGT